MNKALHALVYLILAVSGVALFFEVNLFDKKALLADRNRQLEDYLVKISHTLEKTDAARNAARLRMPTTRQSATRTTSTIRSRSNA